MSKRPKCTFKDCNNEVTKDEYTKRLLPVCKECFESRIQVADQETIIRLKEFVENNKMKNRVVIIPNGSEEQ
jgi:hypothetical protein